MLCMIPELRGFAYVLDRKLLKRMLAYCLPLLVLGLAGILNQVADKIIFPFVYPDEAEAFRTVGHLWGCQQDCHGDGDALHKPSAMHTSLLSSGRAGTRTTSRCMRKP